MATTMEQVRAILDPEEPDYSKGSELGPDAVPHLRTLVNGDDQMLASKAAYLASLIKADDAADVVADAARSPTEAVRVAAAAAARNLPAAKASSVLEPLVTDSDPGVRKVARDAAPRRPTGRLKDLLDASEPGEGEGQEGGDVSAQPFAVTSATMPGEGPATGMSDRGSGLMPGEAAARMPGEGNGRGPTEPGEMPR